MSKFYVGQKVERTNCSYGKAKLGEIYTIKDFLPDNYISLEEIEGEYNVERFRSLPETFEKGDIVSVRRKDFNNNNWVPRRFHEIAHGVILCKHTTKDGEFVTWDEVKKP